MIIKPTIKKCTITELKQAITDAEIIYTPIKNYQTLGANTRLSDLRQIDKQEALNKIEITAGLIEIPRDFFVCYLSSTCIVFD